MRTKGTTPSGEVVKLARLERWQVEQLSERNARRVIRGKDGLPSSGRKGRVTLPRLGRTLPYRSLLEMRFLQAVDRCLLVADVEVEALSIKYLWRGAMLSYVPDALVKLRDGRVWVIEVKPSSQVGEPRNAAKFAAAREFCRSRGNHLRFGVATEKTDARELLSSHDGTPPRR